MVWDFAESDPFNPLANYKAGIEAISITINFVLWQSPSERFSNEFALSSWIDGCHRSALFLTQYLCWSFWFFYVWLKCSIGHLYPEHFPSTNLKKWSHHESLTIWWQQTQSQSLWRDDAPSFQRQQSAKIGGMMVVFMLTKLHLVGNSDWFSTTSWFHNCRSMAIDTERVGRLRSEFCCSASSIFPIARKREVSSVGNYAMEVRPVGRNCERARQNPNGRGCWVPI